MAMTAPPEVDIGEYERRVLASLRGSGDLGIVDVWLEGEHPETQIVVVVQTSAAPAGRYVDRSYLWYSGSDSNPEMAAARSSSTSWKRRPAAWGMGANPAGYTSRNPRCPGPLRDDPTSTSQPTRLPA